MNEKPEMLSDEQVAEIDAREKVASDWPCDVTHIRVDTLFNGADNTGGYHDCPNEADANFLAHAYKDIPALLRDRKALKAERDNECEVKEAALRIAGRHGESIVQLEAEIARWREALGHVYNCDGYSSTVHGKDGEKFVCQGCMEAGALLERSGE